MLRGRIYPRSRLWRPPFEAERRFVQSDAMQGRVDGRNRKEVPIERNSWAGQTKK